MDAQELRNLQEAYMEVYQELDEVVGRGKIDPIDPEDAGVSHETGARSPSQAGLRMSPLERAKLRSNALSKRSDPKAKKRGKDILTRFVNPTERGIDRAINTAGETTAAISQRRRERQSGNVHESYDIYDVILSHLLDEGYAETPEAAEAIMVNMSEEWRDGIVEAYWPWDKPKPNSPSPRDRAALRQSQQQNSRTPAGQERSQQIANVRTNMRQGINKTAERTQTDPRREGTAPFTKRHIDAAMRTGGTAGGKMFAPPSGGPRSTGIPSTRIPASPQLRAANQAAQFRRGGSGSAEGLGSSSGLRGSSPSGTTGRFQVGGGRGYGLGYIKLAN